MEKISSFFIAIFQFILLVDSTRQSHAKQGIKTLKTIGNTVKSPVFKQVGNNIKKPIVTTFGNTIKNSVDMFRRNKNTIKNIAFGFQEKQMTTKHYFGSKTVKYLGEAGIKNFKYKAPHIVKGSMQLVRREGKKNIQMRSAAQMSEKRLAPMVKRLSEQMKGKELGSLINMVSRNTPYLPFLFAAGGISKLTQLSLAGEAFWEFDEDEMKQFKRDLAEDGMNIEDFDNAFKEKVPETRKQEMEPKKKLPDPESKKSKEVAPDGTKTKNQEMEPKEKLPDLKTRVLKRLDSAIPTKEQSTLKPYKNFDDGTEELKGRASDKIDQDLDPKEVKIKKEEKFRDDIDFHLEYQTMMIDTDFGAFQGAKVPDLKPDELTQIGPDGVKSKFVEKEGFKNKVPPLSNDELHKLGNDGTKTQFFDEEAIEKLPDTNSESLKGVDPDVTKTKKHEMEPKEKLPDLDSTELKGVGADATKTKKHEIKPREKLPSIDSEKLKAGLRSGEMLPGEKMPDDLNTTVDSQEMGDENYDLLPDDDPMKLKSVGSDDDVCDIETMVPDEVKKFKEVVNNANLKEVVPDTKKKEVVPDTNSKSQKQDRFEMPPVGYEHPSDEPNMRAGDTTPDWSIVRRAIEKELEEKQEKSRIKWERSFTRRDREAIEKKKQDDWHKIKAEPEKAQYWFRDGGGVEERPGEGFPLNDYTRYEKEQEKVVSEPDMDLSKVTVETDKSKAPHVTIQY